MNIHNYDQRYETARRYVEKSALSAKNKDFIFRFVDSMILNNISKPRLMKYLGTLKIVAEKFAKDFDTVTMDDIKRFVGVVQQRSDYSIYTKQSYKIIIRRFYKWLYDTKEYPPLVSWMTVGISRSQKKLPSDEELLLEHDIQVLLNTAENLRDKAFVSTLWESGGRIGEISNS